VSAVTGFQTTSARGLDFSLPPMRLWKKAKRLGTWDPDAVDLVQDAQDWETLTAEQQDVILHLTSLFQAGEESVTLELLPLIQVVAAEGRLEEEMYLTSFLWEEAKHVEAFRRFLDEVAGEHGDLSRYHGPSYRRIFYEELPASMRRLRTDPSPVAQAEASATYNMIVEGVLAETGYHAYDALLRRNDLMPGMQRIVGHLRRDESRHLAYGVFLLSRLVAEHGDPVWRVIERRLGELVEPAIGMIHEIFARYPVLPFPIEMSEFVDYAVAQFQRRVARLERARLQTLRDVCAEPLETYDD